MNKLDIQFGFLSRLMILMFSVLAAGCGGQDPIFGGGGKLASLAPTVTATTPLATTPMATDVAINSKITATFSKDIDAATVNNTSFTIACPTGTAIAGTVSYVAGSRVASFAPTAPLPANTLCTATIATKVKDTTGLSLANPFIWTFMTGAAPDITRPTITLKVPAAGAVNVAFNAQLTATFSEDMDAASINTNTLLLQGPGASIITGTVTYAAGSRTATFNPTSPLAASTLYTATATTGVKDLAGNTLASNNVWTFTTSVAPDVTRPTVSLKTPDAGETNVAINSKVLITFSENMDPTTMTTANILVKNAGADIAGTVTYAVGAKTATFIPSSPSTLPPSTVLTVTVSSAAKDLAGNALAGDVALLPAASDAVWTFTTGLTPDTTLPTVTLKVPAAGSTGISVNSMITATFSEDMDPLFIRESSFTLQGAGTTVTGIVSYAVGARTAIFMPTSPATLAFNTVYTATLTTSVRDLAGNPLAGNSATPLIANDAVWTFTTGAAPDITPPTVTNKVPAAGATNVAPNSSIIATFSENMDPLTINSNTIIVQGSDSSIITGTVTYAVGAKTVTFNPTSPATLATGSLYTVVVTTGAKDLAGNALTNNASWTFTTIDTPDTTAPTVTLKVPAAGATGVAFNTIVTATFSEDMDPSTLDGTTFTLNAGVTPIVGTVTYSVGARTATFTPTSPATLAASTLYTATITSGAEDLAANNAVANTSWTFTTSAAPDITRPTITLKVPAANDVNVALNTKMVVTFSENMDPLTIDVNSVLLQGPGASAVIGTVSYASGAKTATFTPTATLDANTLYTATVTNSARDLAGNSLLKNTVWTFTTGAGPDLTPPTVLSVNPLSFASGICLQKTISATFSEAIDPLTVSTASVQLKISGGAATSGSVTYDVLNNVTTFTPSSDLLPNTSYTATITTAVKDLANNALASNKVWTFTTGAQSCAQGVNLGTAADFGNLGGGAGTTNQGTLTVIGGDLGSTAVSASAVTGFHDTANDIYTETGSNQGFVNGKIYTCTVSTTGPTAAAVNPVACNVATQARADAMTAFNNLAPGLMPGGTDPGAGQLGGLTLAPGIYEAAGGSFQITGADLTLDAQGDANAVWVFQTATTLTVGAPGAPRSIILINGAQPKNIFWRVGSSATINAAGGGTMVGTILAGSGVSFSTAGNVAIVTLNGRAAGLNASVTMTNTVINVPAP